MERLKRYAIICLTIAIAMPAVWAQGLTGTISGVVKDPNGGVVPSAKVVVRNTGTNSTADTETDGNGYYRFVSLTPGTYSISVEAKGFRKSEVAPQLLSVAAALRGDVILEIGQVTETVSVDASSVQVNTEDAQMGRSLVNIPVLPNISGGAGRNALNLMALQPGIVSTSGGPSTTVGTFSVNGQRAQANNYLLDGTDSNDLAINVPDSVAQISPNAIAEFRVVTGAMKAEYGRNGGAVVEVVTKSGENQFHVSAEDVFRNTLLNASNFFQNVTPGGTVDYFSNGSKRKPQWNTNDYDAQVGGRIRKDKTFFFVNYLGFKRRQAQVTSDTVFTDAERAIIAANGVPAAVNAMKLVPVATGGNTYFGALGNKFDRDQGSVKIDHRFTEKNNLSGTYFIESQRLFSPLAFGGSLLPGFGSVDLTRFQNVILHDIHTFNPTIVNDARASYHRRGAPGVSPVNTTSPASLGFTGIIPDDAGGVGPPFFQTNSISWGNTYQGPQTRYDNTYQFGDTLSWIHGRHAFKFGIDVKAYQQNQIFDFINSGYFGFDGSGTDNGYVKKIIPGLSTDLNDFANGYVADFEQSNSGRQGYRDKFLTGFAQDDWKISPRVTLNLGLRYEYDAPLTEIHNQIVAFRPGQVTTQFKQTQIPGLGHALTPPVGMVYYGDPNVTRSSYQSDYNNFAPRLGIAWDMRGDGKLVLRTGYAMFYDAPVSELSLQFLGKPPLGLQTVINGATDMTHPYPSAVLSPLTQPFPFVPTKPGGTFDYTNVAPIGLTVMDPYFRTPYSMQWNTQIQYQVAKDWMVDAAYVGSSGTKLLNRRQLNPGVITPTATSTNLDQRRIYNLSLAQQSADFGGAVYSGITDQLSNGKSIYNSLQIALNKRLGHGLTMMHGFTWSHGLDYASSLRNNGVGNIYNSALDRGSSDTDIRSRYFGTVVYDLPFFTAQRGVAGKILGGWNLSGVASIQGGIPFNITDSTDRSLTGTLGGNRADYVGGTLVTVDPRQNLFGKQNSYFDGTGGGSATAATSPFFRRVGSGLSVAQGAGRFGTLGRNVFRGPGIENFDISLAKTFKLSERQNLLFRAEGFNFLNHTNFLQPSGNISSASFGRITSARDGRLVQLTLRYFF